jgi:hypothetical protein
VRHRGHSPFLLTPPCSLHAAFAFLSLHRLLQACWRCLTLTPCASLLRLHPPPGSLRPASLAHLVSPAPAQRSTSRRLQNPQSTAVNRCGRRSPPLDLARGKTSKADIFYFHSRRVRYWLSLAFFETGCTFCSGLVERSIRRPTRQRALKPIRWHLHLPMSSVYTTAWAKKSGRVHLV